MVTKKLNRYLNKKFSVEDLNHLRALEREAEPIFDLIKEYLNYNIERSRPNVNEFNITNYTALRAYKDGYVSAMNEILNLIEEEGE